MQELRFLQRARPELFRDNQGDCIVDPALGIIIVFPKVIPVEAQINLSMLEATRETSS